MSPAPSCVNAAVRGVLATSEWTTCPVAATDLRAHTWIADVFQSHRALGLGLVPLVRTPALDAALLIVDEELAQLRAVQRDRARDER